MKRTVYPVLHILLCRKISTIFTLSIRFLSRPLNQSLNPNLKLAVWFSHQWVIEELEENTWWLICSEIKRDTLTTSKYLKLIMEKKILLEFKHIMNQEILLFAQLSKVLIKVTFNFQWQSLSNLIQRILELGKLFQLKLNQNNN